jgi:hypothetical protein
MANQVLLFFLRIKGVRASFIGDNGFECPHRDSLVFLFALFPTRGEVLNLVPARARALPALTDLVSLITADFPALYAIMAEPRRSRAHFGTDPGQRVKQFRGYHAGGVGLWRPILEILPVFHVNSHGRRIQATLYNASMALLPIETV